MPVHEQGGLLSTRLGQLTGANWNRPILWPVASHGKGDYCTPRPQ